MARLIIVLLAVFLSGCLHEESHVPYLPDCSGSGLGAGDIRVAPTSAFVFAGQSNMVGLGEGSSEQISNVVVWIDDHWETYTPKKCFGPDLAFARDWARDNIETVGIIKHAIGGTSMGDWQPSWDASQARFPELGSLFAQLVEQYRAAAVPVMGIIWAQGEADAMFPGMASAYESRLQNFLTSIRAEVGQVPFVLAHTSMPADYLNIIQAAQIALTSWDRVCLVQTSDLPTWEGIHFTSQGQLTLGDRLYNAWGGC